MRHSAESGAASEWRRGRWERFRFDGEPSAAVSEPNSAVARRPLRARGWSGAAAQLGRHSSDDVRDASPSHRTLEIVVAMAMLLFSLPLMLMIAALIKLDSPGPVLFVQKRVGKDGRLFKFLKFRTMHVDARERWPELYAYKYTPEQLKELKFKVPGDPRVTPVGKWLRRTSFDELPNFFNVLTGDMAIVGPRPEIPEMVPYYEGATRQKFSVRPGVTGLAQVSGRGHLSFQETVRLDLEYIRSRSFQSDLQIIMATLKMVAFGRGAF